jgi:hypothetical protein
VPAVAQPRAGGRDLIGRALAPRLQEHGKLDEVGAAPRRERGEELQPLAVGSHRHLDARAVGRGRLAARVARVEPLRGEVDAASTYVNAESWYAETRPLAVHILRTGDLAPIPALLGALTEAGCDHPTVLDALSEPLVPAEACWMVETLAGAEPGTLLHRHL